MAFSDWGFEGVPKDPVAPPPAKNSWLTEDPAQGLEPWQPPVPQQAPWQEQPYYGVVPFQQQQEQPYYGVVPPKPWQVPPPMNTPYSGGMHYPEPPLWQRASENMRQGISGVLGRAAESIARPFQQVAPSFAAVPGIIQDLPGNVDASWAEFGSQFQVTPQGNLKIGAPTFSAQDDWVRRHYRPVTPTAYSQRGGNEDLLPYRDWYRNGFKNAYPAQSTPTNSTWGVTRNWEDSYDAYGQPNRPYAVVQPPPVARPATGSGAYNGGGGAYGGYGGYGGGGYGGGGESNFRWWLNPTVWRI